MTVSQTAWDAAIRGKSALRPAIFHVVQPDAAVRGNLGRGVRIFHDLRVDGTGLAAVARVAECQRGLIHVGQLRAAGITRSVVGRLVAQSMLYPVLPRVFLFGSPPFLPLALETAALLHVGHDAALSHASAAALWGLAEWPEETHLTIVGRDARPRSGLNTYRVPGFHGRDVRLRASLPVTAPARTLIDLAAMASDRVVERAVAEARVQKLVSDRDLEQALARAPVRTGAAKLREIASTDASRLRTRTEIERQLLQLLARAGLPTPETNAWINGCEVDFLWRAQRLIVETDGYEAHGHGSAFESDRRRDQVHVAAGYRVIRVTWRQLEREPLTVIASIAQALAALAVG